MNPFDPFDDAEAQEVAPVDEAIFDQEPADAPPKKAPAKKAAPKKEIVVSDNNAEGKLTITLKGGAGFDSPWIVLHPADLDEALDLLSGDNAGTLVTLMDKVAKAGTHFAGLSPKSSGAAPARPGSEPPAGTPEPPGPGWTYKTGVGKGGKTWKAWMPPRDSDEKPVWL